MIDAEARARNSRMFATRAARIDDASGRGTLRSAQHFGLANGVAICLLAWWLLLQGQEVVSALQSTGPGVATDDFASATESGSAFNTLLIVGFGALGLTQLRRSYRLLGAPRIRPVVILLGVYFAWGLLSLFWSVEPGLTFRRLVQLCLLLVGSVGLGLGFYGRSSKTNRGLVLHLAIAGLISVAALGVVLAVKGGADFLDPAWMGAKAAGIGTNVIYPISVATFALLWMSRRYLPAWLAAAGLLLCVVSLALIKARFITAVTVLAVVLLPLFEGRPTWRRVLPYLVLVSCVAYATVALIAIQGQPALDWIVQQAWTYSTLDTGGADVQTLTGRTPLWTELLRYAADRPWVGYGFGAFWNTDYMPAIAAVVGWNAPSGHNGFLDEVLATGIVGLVLFLSFWAVGFAKVVMVRISRNDAFAMWVAVVMLCFLLCNLGDSILQNYTRYLFYAALVGMFAVLGRHARRDEREHVIVRRSQRPYGVVGMEAEAST
jgi:O-antigen ligase